MGRFAEIAARINTMYQDIRAEVIISDLLAAGIRFDNIAIKCIGQLNRPRSGDIAKSRVSRDHDGREQLELILNRDGIYDTLPEGIFHQPPAGKPSISSVPAMVEECRRHQREEEEARHFFAPFEHELFLQRTSTESKERRQLFQIRQSQLEPPILKKLGIDPGLPRVFTSKLIRILPYIAQITGNITRTEQVFSLLLDDSVALKIDDHSEPETSEHISRLGRVSLGIDAVAGNALVPDHRLFRLIIGPVSKEKLLRYQDGGWKRRTVQTLINFILPAEWDVAITIKIRLADQKSFILHARHPADARLGHTTSLP